MGWYQRADYRWLLLADPPICRSGRPVEVLNNCDRLRRGELCWCRFDTQETLDDLAAIGAPAAADDWLTSGDLESSDVDEFRDAVARTVRRARTAGGRLVSDDVSDALDRLDLLVSRLDRLAKRGSGLSDRYQDDVES